MTGFDRNAEEKRTTKHTKQHEKKEPFFVGLIAVVLGQAETYSRYARNAGETPALQSER